MDVAICAGISLLETVILGSLRGLVTPQSSTIWILTSLFLVQYIAVKFYRVFLYHRYFSPFRHLPGPQVSLLLREAHENTVELSITRSVGKSLLLWPSYQSP